MLYGYIADIASPKLDTGPGGTVIDTHVIKVVPVEGGWSVECCLTGQPLFFLSGGRAEANAKALGACIAGLGNDVQVAVHDRNNALIGTASYFAVEVGSPGPNTPTRTPD